jgi:hypothetical protein
MAAKKEVLEPSQPTGYTIRCVPQARCLMSDVMIQGNWDDLVARQDLHGRRVRIIVLDPERPDERPDNPWLKSLHAWADSHMPLGHLVDDSRESIYSGTIDDPR